MKDRLLIFDTTMRDGEQSPGASMTKDEKLRIAQWIDVRVKKYSKGMTQRLGLAIALLHSPHVLLLDEPTDGVDPVGRREIRDILRAEAAANGTAVLLNSHLLSEIELTCDHVAVLRNGQRSAVVWRLRRRGHRGVERGRGGGRRR